MQLTLHADGRVVEGSMHLPFRSRAITAIPDTLNHCHPDRLRGSAVTEEEWRDPERVSSAMLLQGVSTRIYVPLVWSPMTRASSLIFAACQGGAGL
jgi:hypothetical protein